MATVLIVDDAADTRLLVRTLLTHAGHQVIEAGDGSAGLSTTIANNPDLVLLDLSMPLTSGPEFVRALRADPRTRATAVALYTGTEMTPALCDFMEMYGIRVAIPKPSEPAEFLRAVERALTR
jgi:two-component system, cell cycle sensor histidine kinase and response regulator CckA